MLLDAETLKKSSEMDPQIIEFAKANPLPPLDWSDEATMKVIMTSVSQQGLAMLGPPEAAIVEEYKEIPMRDGFNSSLKIHRPADPPEGGSPLIVFCFAGGWISGDNDGGTPFARAWVRLFGAVAVSISYRLAPQHKFPAASHGSWDSIKWITDHVSELGADPTKGFIVGGISAGGTQAAVITTQAVKNKLAYPLTGQWLSIPSLMNADNVPNKYKAYLLASEHNVDVPVLPLQALADISKHVEWDDNSPLRWPVLSDAPLSSLPPTFLQSDGLDPLRDDALIYEEMLKEAGVPTRINFYPGCPHAHFALFPGIEVTNRAVADIMTGMGWLLGKDITSEQGLGGLAPSA